ncbi:MAG: COX15/CtaA family protein [Spirochaetia bacterium]|nr:COX15/CtaA family protein [Spirochaetia bacterium]
MGLDPKYRSIVIWLFSIYFFVGLMVMVGGITRLTRSGLSIVEWEPFTGIIPPLSETSWQEEFENYKQYPEYKKNNRGMTLEEFKFIFFWEFIHRLLGRLVGFLFLIPFLYFVIRKSLKGKDIYLTAAAFVLGGLQGFMGWFMVESGLREMPRVSHYRLAAHLLLALLIMMYIFWIALYIYFRERRILPELKHAERLRNFSWFITALIVFQIMYGAFTAGIRAGYMYNTFPLMGNSLIPSEIFNLNPAWINFFENMSAIQFIHRTLAWILLPLILFFFFYSKKFHLDRLSRSSIAFLLLSINAQFIIGIFTILYAVPVFLGVLHQMGAVVLLTFSVLINFSLTSRSSRT